MSATAKHTPGQRVSCVALEMRNDVAHRVQEVGLEQRAQRGSLFTERKPWTKIDFGGDYQGKFPCKYEDTWLMGVQRRGVILSDAGQRCCASLWSATYSVLSIDQLTLLLAPNLLTPGDVRI